MTGRGRYRQPPGNTGQFRGRGNVVRFRRPGRIRFGPVHLLAGMMGLSAAGLLGLAVWNVDPMEQAAPGLGGQQPQALARSVTTPEELDAAQPLIPANGAPAGQVQAARGEFACVDPRVTDGDTLRCGDVRVRLQGIDSAELPGHCREGRDCVAGDPFAARDNLRRLVAAGRVICRQSDTDGYGRVVARCSAGGVDLSCRQIADGHAVRRYTDIRC